MELEQPSVPIPEKPCGDCYTWPLAAAMMVDYRDESGYADSLGILSAGPLGGFTASMVVTNADGYRYVVASMVDGYPGRASRSTAT